MARETKTVQCYPSDERINATCREYGAFGWELIGNQRCTENNGTYGGFTHTTTFNKLTFSREKSSPWYGEVVALESEHERLMNSEPHNNAKDPSKIWVILGGICLFLCALTLAGLWGLGLLRFTFYLPLMLAVVGILFIVFFIVKKVRYNKDYSAYCSRKRDWEDTAEKKARELRSKAETLVNGN